MFYLRDDDTVRVGRVVGTVLSVVLLGFLIWGAVYAITYFTAETRGRIALHNQVRSATELQASYEYFHDTCRSVIAQTQQISQQQSALADAEKNAPANDPFGQYASGLQQQRTDITGLENVRASTAQAYNAKSHEFTHNFMRSNDLPVEIGPPSGVPYSALQCENQKG